jgi:hypothetical protein
VSCAAIGAAKVKMTLAASGDSGGVVILAMM